MGRTKLAQQARNRAVTTYVVSSDTNRMKFPVAERFADLTRNNFKSMILRCAKYCGDRQRGWRQQRRRIANSLEIA
jgi:hypothetical protein